MEDILRLTKICKSFPGVKALSDVNLTIKKGEVHALVGENGAGKSTLMKTISGAYKKDEGSIWFDGRDVEVTSPKQSELMGISIIYQELNLIERISVAENVFIGRYPLKSGFVQWGKMYKDAQALFDEFDLKIDARRLVRSLTMAQKQMVEIIKAVSINAKVIIMDEPTSSLSTKETESLFKIINKLKSNGVAVVFISHRLDEIFTICDRVTVLRDGCYVGDRDISDITKNEMISMMIGRELTQQYPERSNAIGDVVLEVKNLTDGGKSVNDVSFAARKGEVLGFYGLVGAGRTETMRMIFGIDKKISGKVLLNGTEVTLKSPRDAIKHSIGFITENRRDEGLFLRSSIRVNTVMVALHKILKHGFISYKKEKEVSEEYVKKLRTVTPSINQKAMFLSGGNQQKVVLSKWLFSDSEIIIFDEPTRGIDVGARREIYQIINDLVGNGCTVVVVSSDLEEIIGISDRILVMHEGNIAGEVLKEDFSQNLITKYAVGEGA
ncbi:MAG: sugar ABC transporter ATP-binding protein [Anaerolineaceae bacterium]|nr:MAG: sugar ABC transporter ATP-binding protein [Anaerolineaceae bacterium]